MQRGECFTLELDGLPGAAFGRRRRAPPRARASMTPFGWKRSAGMGTLLRAEQPLHLRRPVHVDSPLRRSTTLPASRGCGPAAGANAARIAFQSSQC